jgi:hypothetical protein
VTSASTQSIAAGAALLTRRSTIPARGCGANAESRGTGGRTLRISRRARWPPIESTVPPGPRNSSPGNSTLCCPGRHTTTGYATSAESPRTTTRARPRTSIGSEGSQSAARTVWPAGTGTVRLTHTVSPTVGAGPCRMRLVPSHTLGRTNAIKDPGGIVMRD